MLWYTAHLAIGVWCDVIRSLECLRQVFLDRHVWHVDVSSLQSSAWALRDCWAAKCISCSTAWCTQESFKMRSQYVRISTQQHWNSKQSSKLVKLSPWLRVKIVNVQLGRFLLYSKMQSKSHSGSLSKHHLSICSHKITGYKVAKNTNCWPLMARTWWLLRIPTRQVKVSACTACLLRHYRNSSGVGRCCHGKRAQRWILLCIHITDQKEQAFIYHISLQSSFDLSNVLGSHDTHTEVRADLCLDLNSAW